MRVYMLNIWEIYNGARTSSHNDEMVCARPNVTVFYEYDEIWREQLTWYSSPNTFSGYIKY